MINRTCHKDSSFLKIETFVQRGAVLQSLSDEMLAINTQKIKCLDFSLKIKLTISFVFKGRPI